VAAGATIAVLAGCAGATPSGRENNGDYLSGRDLVCVGYDGKQSTTNYDCDFDGFYANPAYKAPEAMKRIDDGDLSEHSITYRGGALHCLTFASSGATTGMTCDYARFHQDYPTAQ